MRVAMFALMVGTMLGSTPMIAHAQTTGPVLRGDPQRVERDRDRDRRDGSWDWRRDDRRRGDRDDRYDSRRDGRRDDRRDRDYQRNTQRRERELQKRVQQCQRDMWRSSRYSRNDRWGRHDQRDVYRERERIERVCERQVYGRGRGW